MDETQARHVALEMAIRECPGGTRWTAILERADMFAAFIIAGTVPKAEDAA